MFDKTFRQTKSLHKWDKFFIGFLLGLIAPVVGVFLFYLMKSGETTFEHYLEILQNKIFLSPLLSLGCVMDAFVFFLLLRKDLYNAARGVILGMVIWIIPIVWAKFF